jgi:hypothetical protein
MIKLLLWVFIIILITCYYKKSVKSKSHIRKFVYFDEEVDFIPKLNIIENDSLQESMDNGNHIPFTKNRAVKNKTNLISSRWSGSGNSQPKRDSIGRTHHLDSVLAIPSDYNPSVNHKNLFGKHVQHLTQMNKLRRTNDLQDINSESYENEEKDYKALDLHMPSLYDSKFNTPNIKQINNQIIRTPVQLETQVINRMPSSREYYDY